MNRQKEQALSIALLIVLIVMATYAGMRSDAPKQAALPTQALTLIPPIDPPPPPTAIPTNVSSEILYKIHPAPVMVMVDVLPVYEAPRKGSEKIGEYYLSYVWVLQEVQSTHDGNYWGRLGNGWVLLYDAQVLEHEPTDWSLEKWIGNGKQ